MEGERLQQAYAIADQSWIGTRKTSPAGLTLAELEHRVQGLKEAAL